MSDIQELLGSLKQSRITPAVLDALDYVVPGEWHNVTSVEEAVRVHCGVTDPTTVMAIRNKALELYASQPHYARAVRIFQAVDQVDKVAAAAVMANQVGRSFQVLSILDRFTPKAETTQAIDAALKLTAEVAAFATLRGIPVTSLTEAKAFPATLATYARADLMRLAAWMTLDGLVPLGPEFIDKVRDVVSGIDLSVLTNNPLFQQLKGMLPGSTDEENRGVILSALDSASDWVSTFIEARGLTRDGLASKLGGVVNVAEAGLDVLGATLDATTDYFAHTGVQSVARVLVHDAQEALGAGVATPPPLPQAEVPAAAPVEAAAEGGWFGKMAAAAAGGAAGVAVGAMMFRGRGDDDKAADALGDLDDVDDADLDDPSLDDLDEGSFAAREAALEMKARELMAMEARMDRKKARMMRRKLMMEREMLRRSRGRKGRRGMGGGRRRGRGRGRRRA